MYHPLYRTINHFEFNRGLLYKPNFGKIRDFCKNVNISIHRHVLNNKMRTDNAAANAKEVMRLFQYLTMVLMSTYHHAELTRNASSSALHDLFHVIISNNYFFN